MQAIILAAGYATRLEPLTLTCPKPLLSVGKWTIIDRIAQKLDAIKEMRAAYVISNGKFFTNFDQWAKNRNGRIRIGVINDHSTSNANRLGAIRDLELVISGQAIDDDVLVVAGDNIFGFELAKFLAFANTRKDGVSIAVHDIKDRAEARSFGVVKIDDEAKVVDFEEKPAEPKSTLISTGIYFFPKNKLPFIKEYVTMQNIMDAPGNYIGWLSRKDKVYGFAFPEEWYDIGNIDSYNKADHEFKEKEK